MTVELGALGGICAETLGAIAKKGVAAASKRSFARHEENNGTTKAFKQRELPFSEFTGLPHRSVAAQYGFVAKHFSSHKKNARKVFIGRAAGLRALRGWQSPAEAPSREDTGRNNPNGGELNKDCRLRRDTCWER